jgi:hypothetical protein
LWASQVAPGQDNGLRLRIFGEDGALDWRQDEPNRLIWSPLGEAARLLNRGTAAINPSGQRVSRIPAGHPEGYLEAFATIYTEVAATVTARRSGSAIDPAVTFPNHRGRFCRYCDGGRRLALKRGRRDLDDNGAVTRKALQATKEFNDARKKRKRAARYAGRPEVVLGGRSQARLQPSPC